MSVNILSIKQWLKTNYQHAQYNLAHRPPRLLFFLTIRLPLAESEYDRFLNDRAYAKARLDELDEDFPALFPETFPWGYDLYGFTSLPPLHRTVSWEHSLLSQPPKQT